MRDDKLDENNDVPLLSPISLRHREIKNNSCTSQIYTDSTNSYQETHYDSSNLDVSEISISSLDFSTVSARGDNLESGSALDKLMNVSEKENNHINTDLSVSDIRISKEINLTTQKASCDNSELTVQKSSIPRWKKEYSCPFCHKMIVGQ